MNALALLDSRSFRNKLDAFVMVASKKRATDEDIAEYLQPVLDAAAAFGGVPVPKQPALASEMGKPLTDEERIIPQKQRSILEVMDDFIAEYTPRVSAVGMGPNGIRWVAMPPDTQVSELTGYTNDKTDAPWFIDASEMTGMIAQGPQAGWWSVPCRMR